MATSWLSCVSGGEYRDADHKNLPNSYNKEGKDISEIEAIFYNLVNSVDVIKKS